MNKFTLILLSALIALTAAVSCKFEPPIEEKLNAYIQSYLYAVRDGKTDEVYNTMLSAKMKEVFTIEDWNEYVSRVYKGKIGQELRTAYATIVKEKSTGEFIEATGRTSNMGRMGNVMNQDETLIFQVHVVNENGQFKVEQSEDMTALQEEKDAQKRLDELLNNYQGLVKLEDVMVEPLPQRPGWALVSGTILNASSDLDMVRVGVKIRLKDSAGDIIYAQKFFPVLDVRYEGLRTSVLPGDSKLFQTPIKDIPVEWDKSQPPDFQFYLIDGTVISEEDLKKEIVDRDKMRKLVEETRKGDEEARRQMNEQWDKEKRLKAKIKAMQERSKTKEEKK
ncbi:MAG TPA: hypothetical protein P5077_07085 [bacterium]|nr:hypothetical protein [bacterium]